MIDVMKTGLSLSLSGGMMILVLWLSGKWFRERFSRRWQYYIWLLVIARLWIPLAPEQNLVGSLFRGIEKTGSWVEQTVEDVNDSYYAYQEQNAGWAEWEEHPAGDSGAGQTNGSVRDNASAQELVTESGSPIFPAGLSSLLSWAKRAVRTAAVSLGIIWLAGALFLFTYKITLYRRFTKTLKAGCAEPEDMEVLERFGRLVERAGIRGPVRLYTNPQAASPLLMGFFHPWIVLPTTELPEKEFTYTILHELTHLKRLDMFYKWLVQITVCVHWFNPLVHLMGREIDRLCELSCDEALIREMDGEERRAYGDTLLHAMAFDGGYQNHLASVTLCEGKELLKERLGAIMKYGKKSRVFTALTFVCTIILMAGAVTMGAYGASSSQSALPWGAGQWESRGENGKVTHAYRMDGYYEAPYIIELGWNLSSSAYDAYAGKADIVLKNGEVVKTAFDKSCASFQEEDAFMTALTALVQRLSEKDLNSHFNFKLERPLVVSVVDVSGKDLAALAGEFYRDEKLTGFTAIFPELERSVQESLCDAVYEDSNVAFYSCIVQELDAEMLDKYLERAYRDNRITFFSEGAWNLTDEKAAAYARRAYDDGRITFFNEMLPYLPKEEIKAYAEQAYQNDNIAFFSVVASYLSEEDYKAFTDRARRDKNTAFYSVLSDMY
ncbi:MAG: hypothetical protein KHZ58_13720 [Hungatella hathewayi]|nr:hypothetical protein [Hungatella hathewayi]